MTIPKQILDKFNTMFFKLLWSNKNEKIKRRTLIGQKWKGGIDMPDIYTLNKTLKLKWINSLTNQITANWKIIPNFFLSQYGKDFLIFNMNTDSLKNLPKPKLKIPSFYIEIVEHLIELKNCEISKTPKHFTTFELK
jgi:hypothetical protein